jgi:hypothetical protein
LTPQTEISAGVVLFKAPTPPPPIVSPVGNLGTGAAVAVAPSLLPQNQLPGAIFGDGVPNLLLQGSLRLADIPAVPVPGRLSLSYAGSGGAAQPTGTAVERPAPVSSVSQDDLDEAFADPLFPD